MNPEEKAIKHAEWYSDHFSVIVKKVYQDAFIHGFKHGQEEEKIKGDTRWKKM